MPPSLSWIEPDVLRARIERAKVPPGSSMAPPRRAEVRASTPLPAAGGARGTRRASEDPPVTVGPSSAFDTGDLYWAPSSPTPAPEPTRFEPSPGPTRIADVPSDRGQSRDGAPSPGLPARLEVLAASIRPRATSRRWFIADEEGLPLMMEGVTETQAVSAAVLARALRPLRGFIGSEHVASASLELDAGRTWHTIWASTRIGRLALCIESQDPLTAPALAELRAALGRAIDG